MSAVETAQIDAQAIRIRAWCVKGLDTAVFAKCVLSSTCIKGIGRNGVFAAEQSKPRGRHNHLIAATLIADRTVTGMSV
jgi:hypothetical protein